MVDVQQLRATQAASNAEQAGGAWADAPDLAASTVAMTNTSGLPVNVYISAGTVTVVKVDDATTGLTTPATVPLRPGSALKITYSVAPTLAWIF